MQNFFRRKIDLAIFLATSSCILLLSFGTEYVANKDPCILCKLQRIPYFLIAIFSLIGMAKFDRKWIYYGIGIALVFGICLSSYHFLVQYEMVSDPCKVVKVKTMEDFANLMAKNTSCKQVSWAIFGISVSAWNLFFLINWIAVLIYFYDALQNTTAFAPYISVLKNGALRRIK